MYNLFFISKAYAQQPWGFPLLNNPNPENYGLLDVLAFIGNIINIALILASVIAVIYIIIGGYKYVLSSGNPEVAQQAKNTLFWAIMGLIICVVAYTVIQFVWRRIIGGSLPTP